jgi:hypothetical protein
MEMQRQKVHMLVVTEGPMVGERYALHNIISTLGRASSNTIVLESPQISRLHAQIRLQPHGVMIEDMGSVNGTFVNGRRLEAPHLLSPGDRIRFAEFATLQYVVQERSDAVPSAPSSLEGPTRVTDDQFGSAAAPPMPSSYERPTVAARPSPPSVAYQPVAPERAPVQRTSASSTQRPAVAEPGRPSWLYGVIVVLLLLLCLCVALAVFLWFAPVTFWERVFDLVGVPMPSGVLVPAVRGVLGLV